MLADSIERCFDSHVHLFLTGEHADYLDLSSLGQIEDILNVKPALPNYRGDWILGLGWDINKWKDFDEPYLQIIDQAFPSNPVFFAGIDGHSAWVNSRAIERVSTVFSLNGVLNDNDMKFFRAVIPKPNAEQLKAHAVRGLDKFSEQGYKYLRDMTSSEEQWRILYDLEVKGQLPQFVELFFYSDEGSGLFSQIDNQIKTILKIKNIKSRRLRVKGIKIFYDGALGSSGALVSEPYCDLRSQKHSCQGLRQLSREELKKIIVRVWSAGLEIAIHALGDLAVHEVLEVAESIMKEGVSGQLHLEHVEILHPRSYSLMERVRPTCHLQPSHFLSDRRWLRPKIGDLANFAFPWRILEDLQIPFYFGSDSPIVPARIELTEDGLREAEKFGIRSLTSDWRQRHVHPDSEWVLN